MLSDKKIRYYQENIPYQLIRIGYGCNINCMFCNVEHYNFKSRNDKIIFYNLFKKIMQKSSLKSNISISGGEPTLYRKELISLIKLLKYKGANKIEVQTNGIALSDYDFTRTLVQNGLTNAFVSLHSFKEKTHDVLVQKKGAYSLCLKGIENLLKLNVEVVLNPVICAYNYKEIKKYFAFIINNFPKIKSISLSIVQPRGEAFKNKDVIPSYDIISPYIEEALEYAFENKLTINNPICGLPLCVGNWYKYRDNCVEYIITKLNKKISIDKIHLKICSLCKFNKFCKGIWPEYYTIHKDRGIKPIFP